MTINKKIIIDGYFGPITKNNFINIKKGAKGNLTWLCQAFLYIKKYNPKNLNGTFDNNMLNAIKLFQKNNKLNQDGIIGKNTAFKLFN